MSGESWRHQRLFNPPSLTLKVRLFIFDIDGLVDEDFIKENLPILYGSVLCTHHSLFKWVNFMYYVLWYCFMYTGYLYYMGPFYVLIPIYYMGPFNVHSLFNCRSILIPHPST